MSTEKYLSAYRLDQAKDCLLDAKLCYEHGRYKVAANRIYYCVFHSMRSVLALDRLDFKKHFGVIAKFREKYIKTQIFEVELSEIIETTYDMRAESDYKDYITFSKEEIEEQLQNAEYFFTQVPKYLEGK